MRKSLPIWPLAPPLSPEASAPERRGVFFQRVCIDRYISRGWAEKDGHTGVSPKRAGAALETAVLFL